MLGPMASDLRAQLQSSLGSAYSLGSELGGGGMSRVFVADDLMLGRRVVVKVLPPELATGLSVERFAREVRLAARLQHPHIVPVLAAGESAGGPYYTMPLVDGESLRDRLARAGELPVTDAVHILRDLAQALAYAHKQGVVHRDIKPENVLLAEGGALVADFGIAKALAAAAGGQGAPAPSAADGKGLSNPLTSIGVAIGTPAYMAPEQAAGDPAVDHRADLYALGAVAYELLAGQPPFDGRSPHQMFAAHATEQPRPLRERRPAVPAALAALIMRCLEKRPADRPQSADEVLRMLDAMATGDGTASSAAARAGRAGAWGRRIGILQALGLYAVAVVVVLGAARAATAGIGLPDWVLPGAALVMALGLPVLALTALVQRAAATPPERASGDDGAPRTSTGVHRAALAARPWFTWRAVGLGGVAAVSLFALLVAGYMTARALGIGPAGSLMAAGVLGERERVLVAEFRGPPADTTLGAAVSEALRTDLDQSRNLSLVQPSAVREVLARMRRPAGTRVDFPVAREIALRDGIKAVVDGEVVSLGGRYVLSARLVDAQSGGVLAAARATADDANGIIPAIGRLSSVLRERVGESLRSVRAAPPLAEVTTPSLEALRKYAQGVDAAELRGDIAASTALLEDAIALDSGFAMAYRKLAIEMANQNRPARASTLFQQAFDHRDRLTESERNLTLAGYYQYGPAPDLAKSIAAYEALIESRPEYVVPFTNASALYMEHTRQFARAEELATRAVALRSAPAAPFLNLIDAQLALGKLDAAQRTVELFAARFPAHPAPGSIAAMLMALRGQHDSAAAFYAERLRTGGDNLSLRARGSFALGALALERGQVAEARRRLRQAYLARSEQGVAPAPLIGALEEAAADAMYFDARDRAVRAVEDALARHPLDSIPAVERPYALLVRVYSLGGRPDQARSALLAFDRSRMTARAPTDDRLRSTMRGDIALAERRYDDAVREFRDADRSGCVACTLPVLARAYDLAGDADSAAAIYARYLELPSLDRMVITSESVYHTDALYRAGALVRLGELSENRGDKARAASTYARFIALWQDADPELQPKVAEARRRLAAIQRAEGR
jgi:eukaryotic-like serine/threonine-protein kinase